MKNYEVYKTRLNNFLIFKVCFTKMAFTLVELVIVITILGILWVIAFLSLQWYSESSRDSVRLSDLSNIAEFSDWLTYVKI